MSALLELFKSSSAFFGGNAAFIEDLYERFLLDPASVDDAWRQRFEQLHREAANEVPHGPVRENFLRLGRERGRWIRRGIRLGIRLDLDRGV